MVTITRLPVYDDDEVGVFHPICESALNQALANLGLDKDFKVLHHEAVGSLEADFALIRESTKKYVLFIEVKRKPAAVSSTRYRIQAQSYVQEAKTAVEKPYYAITNLEVLDVFKYDSSRPSVTQQIIEPSPVRIGTFSDNPADFFNNLVKTFEDIITIVVSDSGTYKELTGSFVPLLENNKTNQQRWHQSLLVAGYEYIRGVMQASKRSVTWKAALNYKNRPNKLVENIRSVNFSSLVVPPLPVSKDSEIWNTSMLEDLVELGQKTMSGDELAELVHSIAVSGREHEGLVPTDLELANILAILSKYVLGRELNENEIICDPAAGSGNLLAAIRAGFDTINPKQLWANDKEQLFLELLSIRLGLMFPLIVSPTNSPLVTGKDICDLNKDDFGDVSVVLMNPPYVSGVKDSRTKKKVAARIYDISGTLSETNVGQVGVEAPFLELVTNLVKDNTIISVVFPKQYLTAKGREAEAVRNYLLNDFGLNLIFIYPRKGIFEDVIKDTVVLIGSKNNPFDKVKVIKSEIPLAEINLTKFKQGLNNLKTNSSIHSLAYGVNIRELNANDLHQKVKDGWRNLTNVGENIDIWINSTLIPVSEKLSRVHNLKRGRIGNAGASDLLFINSNHKLWELVKDIIPKDWLYPALRLVKDINNVFVNSSTTDVRLLAPCEKAFQTGTKEYNILEKILDIYEKVKAESLAQTKQQKKIKTKEELRKILNRERKKITSAHTILIPRNVRKYARVFITTQSAYISTNVIEVTGGTIEQKWITFSWLLSIFSQLQLEVMSKEQEGARKTEIGSIEDLLLPKFENIDNKIVQKLINEAKTRIGFLDLCNPSTTRLDKLWAEVLSSLSSSKPEEILNQALFLLEEKVNERYPEYLASDDE